MIDACHQAGIAVIIDFVPGHFPKDTWALASFDGHPCYEYHDPREGEHKEWGTHVFNYRRPEVRNFLIGAALHWIREYHIDGLRVDAVSSMLYRNYDRKEGEWIANEEGGMENREAEQFLQELTSTIQMNHAGVLMIAEESTAWPDITTATEESGLGFDWKWNMGWMHDSLRYLAQDPLMRSGCHDWITFHQWYAYDERWVLPLSHDEVVHGKCSLIDKFPGNYQQRLAQVRLLFAWQACIPGRPLVFMGLEFGAGREWDWQRQLDWHEAELPERQGLQRCLAAWLQAYRTLPALHADDDHRAGFTWIDNENRQESVVAFSRQKANSRQEAVSGVLADGRVSEDCSSTKQDPSHSMVIAVFNFTPVLRRDYLLMVPHAGIWDVLINSDDTAFAGEHLGTSAGTAITAQQQHDTADGAKAELRVDIPPHGALLLQLRVQQ